MAEVKKLDFRKPKDEERASQYSKNVLEELRVESGANTLTITSAIRTEEEQAAAMYDNEIEREKYHDLADDLKDDIKAEVAAARSQAADIIAKLDGGSFSDADMSRYQRQIPSLEKYDKLKKLEKANDIPYASVLGKDVKKIARADSKKPLAERQREATIEKMAIAMKKKGLIHVTNHAGAKGIEVFDISIKKLTADEQKKFKAAVTQRLGGSIYRFGYPGAPRGNYTFNDKVFHIEIKMPVERGTPAAERAGRTG